MYRFKEQFLLSWKKTQTVFFTLVIALLFANFAEAMEEGGEGESFISLTVSTDKPTYYITDSVEILDVVQNTSSTDTISGVNLQIDILNSSGVSVFGEGEGGGAIVRNIGNISPGVIQNFYDTYSFVNLPVGTYTIVSKIGGPNNASFVQTTTTFDVTDSLLFLLDGNVTVTIPSIEAGTAQQCIYDVMNNGSIDLTDQAFRQLVSFVDTDQEISTSEFPLSIASGTSEQSIQTFDTTGLASGNYECVLQVNFGGEWQSIDNEAFEVIEKPVSIALSAEVGEKGRILILLDDDNQCTDDPYGPESAPTLLEQKQLLESVLTDAGWSYTITMSLHDFMKEQRTGAYGIYLLMSELIDLPHFAQKELREAVYRGEGLIEAGRRSKQLEVLRDAFGISQQLSNRSYQGLELKESDLHTADNVDFTHRDKNIRVRTSGETVVAGQYIAGEDSEGHYSKYSGHSKNKYSSHSKGKRSGHSKNKHSSHSKSKHSGHSKSSGYGHSKYSGHGYGHSSYSKYSQSHKGKHYHGSRHYNKYDKYHCPEVPKENAAITLNEYGLGKTVFMGFDVLMEAQSLGVDDSVFVDLILNSLEQVNPDPVVGTIGTDYPLVFTVTNTGNATPARLVMPVLEGVSIVDAGTGSVDDDRQAIVWEFDLDVDEQQTFAVWVQMPELVTTVNASVEVGDVDFAQELATVSIDLSPVDDITLAEIIANIPSDNDYRSIESQLNNIENKFNEGEFDWVLKQLLLLTNQINERQKHDDNDALVDLRIQLDLFIKQIAKGLVYESNRRHHRCVLRGHWKQYQGGGAGHHVYTPRYCGYKHPDHGGGHHGSDKGKGHHGSKGKGHHGSKGKGHHGSKGKGHHGYYLSGKSDDYSNKYSSYSSKYRYVK
jgi:hypothetical protein